MRIALLAALVVVALPAIAAADEFGLLKPADCLPNGQVENRVLRQRLITDKKVLLTDKTAQALAGSSLGTMARQANADCMGTCSPEAQTLAELYKTASDLFADGWADDRIHTIDIDESQAPEAGAAGGVLRAEVFLNGQADWLEIRCSPARIAEARQQPVAPPAPSPFWDKLVIGGAVTDVAATFDKRSFATVGYSNDNQAGTETMNVDLMLGWKPFPVAGRGSFHQVDLAPYAEYERKTAEERSKELNDLSFGASLIGFGNWGETATFAWTLSGSWQTDDRFNASLAKVEGAIAPPSLGVCSRRSTGKFALRCSGRALLDYVDVADPGDKPALATMTDYARAGVDLELVAGWDTATSGFLTFRALYQARADLGDSGADATLWTVELGLQPSKTSNFNISVGYTDGEALTSFTPTEQFQIKLGVRK